MASLGAAKTGKFAIGTAELRVGPLTLAGKLNRKHGVGLIDSATLNVEQTSVDLKGGFPQVIMDTQVTDQSAQITATLREFSRRNLGILLGQGLVYDDSNDTNDAVTATTASYTAGGASLAVPAGAIGAGDTQFAGAPWISVWNPADAAESVISKVSSCAGTTLTLDSEFLIPVDMPSGAKVSKLVPISVGNVSQVQYFSAQLITIDRQSGRPKISNFWKLAIGSGMSLANNATDFASTEMVLKVLQPSLADYEKVGSPLYHLRNIIGAYPMGMMGEVSDESIAA
jgi:hypothetical protein